MAAADHELSAKQIGALPPLGRIVRHIGYRLVPYVRAEDHHALITFDLAAFRHRRIETEVKYAYVEQSDLLIVSHVHAADLGFFTSSLDGGTGEILRHEVPVFVLDARDLSIRGALLRGSGGWLLDRYATSPSGELVAFWHMGSLSVFQLSPLSLLQTIKISEHTIEAVQFLEDNETLVLTLKASNWQLLHRKLRLRNQPSPCNALSLESLDGLWEGPPPPDNRRFVLVPSSQEKQQPVVPVPIGDDRLLSIRGNGVETEASLVLEHIALSSKSGVEEQEPIARCTIAYPSKIRDVVVDAGGLIAKVRTTIDELWTWDLDTGTLLERGPAAFDRRPTPSADLDLVFSVMADGYFPKRTITARSFATGDARWSIMLDRVYLATSEPCFVKGKNLVAVLVSERRNDFMVLPSTLLFLDAQDGHAVGKLPLNNIADNDAHLGVAPDGSAIVIAHRATALSVLHVE